MKKFSRILSLVVVVALMITAASTAIIAQADSVNLAAGATVSVSGVDSQNTFLGPLANDGDGATRWASGANPVEANGWELEVPAWLALDFGTAKTFNFVGIDWEAGRAANGGWVLQTSTDGTNWTDINDVDFFFAAEEKVGSDSHYPDYATFDAVTSRYLRVYITVAGDKNGPSIWEVEVYNDEEGETSSQEPVSSLEPVSSQEAVSSKAPTSSTAVSSTAVSSTATSVEASEEASSVESKSASWGNIAPTAKVEVSGVDSQNTFLGKYAIDGDKTTRWASGANPVEKEGWKLEKAAWISLDFGKVRTIDGIKVDWEAGRAANDGWVVQTSADGTTWTDIDATFDFGEETKTGEASHYLDTVTFEQLDTQYLRVYVTKAADKNGPSIWELEVNALLEDGESIDTPDTGVEHTAIIWALIAVAAVACAAVAVTTKKATK